MEIGDLIPIGRLGRRQYEGHIGLKRYTNFVPEFLDVKDVFLLFTDNRVRYVTVASVLTQGGRVYMRFAEQEVHDEILQAGDCKLCLDPADAATVDASTWNPVGLPVWEGNSRLGTVVDCVFVGVYHLLSIEQDDGTVFMLPAVEEYVTKVSLKSITVQNTKQLQEL